MNRPPIIGYIIAFPNGTVAECVKFSEDDQAGRPAMGDSATLFESKRAAERAIARSARQRVKGGLHSLDSTGWRIYPVRLREDTAQRTGPRGARTGGGGGASDESAPAAPAPVVAGALPHAP